MSNRQFLLAARPQGLPRPSDWDFVETPRPEPQDGEFLVQISHISLDPAMRGWMNAGKSYVPPVAIGEVMRAYAAGEVIASHHPEFHVGDRVTGLFGVQDYAVSDGQAVHKVDTALAPLPMYLGTLGMPGMTAYFGLLEVGELRAGDSVVVSGAAGAVGSIVGQLARLRGGRAIGIAGSAEKCRFVVDELGFDGCIDYRNEDLKAALKAHCPDGVDVYFDNVVGEILDSVLTQLAFQARVVICGAISQYNATGAIRGPSNYLSLLVNRASMKGMVVFDHASGYAAAAREMAAWLQQGELKSREHLVHDLEQFPNALLMLFEGQNLGKLILQIR